jgi:hypothetical protein
MPIIKKRGAKIMPYNEFEKKCLELVRDYTNEHLDKSDGLEITKDNVFIVWSCKTLQNNKALLSTDLFDGMYYEITYNGNKNEFYLDAYEKFENRCIKVGNSTTL